MAKPIFYRQCEIFSGEVKTIGWIKEDSARLGVRLQILENPGIPEDTLWTVKSVGSVRLPEMEAKDMERQFAKHRKASDI